ncbi:MAG: hypothetical protein RLY40_62 [Pseudomonadota bacterium]|jgi:hypothetical protein
MAINHSYIPSLLRPDLADVFGNWNTYDALWKKVYKQFRSEKAAEYDMEMQGLGLAQPKNDGSPVASSYFQQANMTSYVHQYYGLSFAITRAAIMDNLYKSQFPQQAMQLRNSLETLKNMNATYIFNNAFNSNSTVSDGKSLCATDHPISTGTLANTFTNQVGFTEAAVEDAISLIRSWQNVAGLQIDVNTIKVLTPPKLGFQAARIFKSEYQTDTGNNNINALVHDKYMPGGYIINPFLTNPNNWFILTDEPNGFKYYLRENLDIDFVTDVLADIITVRAIERYCFGCSNWRAVFGVRG